MPLGVGKIMAQSLFHYSPLNPDKSTIKWGKKTVC